MEKTYQYFLPKKKLFYYYMLAITPFIALHTFLCLMLIRSITNPVDFAFVLDNAMAVYIATAAFVPIGFGIIYPIYYLSNLKKMLSIEIDSEHLTLNFHTHSRKWKWNEISGLNLEEFYPTRNLYYVHLKNLTSFLYTPALPPLRRMTDDLLPFLPSLMLIYRNPKLSTRPFLVFKDRSPFQKNAPMRLSPDSFGFVTFPMIFFDYYQVFDTIKQYYTVTEESKYEDTPYHDPHRGGVLKQRRISLE